MEMTASDHARRWVMGVRWWGMNLFEDDQEEFQGVKVEKVVKALDLKIS